MKNLFVALTATLLITFAAFSTIRYVPSQYAAIQDAVLASSSGDTVMVAAGTYYEHVTININLTLLGENMDNTIIDAMNIEKCIMISGNGSTGKVSGFTLMNSGTGYSGGTYNSGIVVSTYGTGFWEICWNRIKECPTGMLNFDGGQVYRNIFEGCGSSSFPRAIFASSGSTLEIFNNDFRANNYAIYAHAAVVSIDVFNNIISTNSVGISLNNSVYTIDYNDVWNNATNYMSCSAGPHDISADPLFIGGTPYDYHLQAGSPCIDAGNPASPPDPDGTTADMGVYYYPQAAMDLAIELTPYGTPIQIPANGGSFSFNVAVTNNEVSPSTFDVWTMVTLPSGGEYGPLINVNVTLPGGASVDRDRIQAVPGGAPMGTYTYDGYVGFYPSLILDEDHFDFTKLAVGDGSQLENGWECYGEEFGEIAGSTELHPDDYTVLSANPNPFNPTTNLRYNLKESGHIRLAVYDIQGREIINLAEGFTNAGYHEINFDASNFASGVYFAILQTGNDLLTQKLLLVK